MHYFIDSGEVGNAHFTISPEFDFAVTSISRHANISLVEKSPFRGVFKLELSMEVPKETTIDGKERSKEMVTLPVTYWITLDKNSKKVRIKTTVVNNAKDHKLRVVFPFGIKTDYVYVESAFSIEKRCILWMDTKDNVERFPYQPMQNFVDMVDEEGGVTFISKGLREYEVMNDKNRSLAIKLIRTQHAYMTANDIMTAEELEKYTDSHVLGEIEFKYVLYFAPSECTYQ